MCELLSRGALLWAVVDIWSIPEPTTLVLQCALLDLSRNLRDGAPRVFGVDAAVSAPAAVGGTEPRNRRSAELLRG